MPTEPSMILAALTELSANLSTVTAPLASSFMPTEPSMILAALTELSANLLTLTAPLASSLVPTEPSIILAALTELSASWSIVTLPEAILALANVRTELSGFPSILSLASVTFANRISVPSLLGGDVVLLTNGRSVMRLY